MHKSAWSADAALVGLQILVVPVGPICIFFAGPAIVLLLLALLRLGNLTHCTSCRGESCLPARQCKRFCCLLLRNSVVFGTGYGFTTPCAVGCVGRLAARASVFFFAYILSLYHGLFVCLVQLLATPLAAPEPQPNEGAGTNPGTRPVLLLTPSVGCLFTGA